MPKPTEKDRLAQWMQRVDSANRVFDEWSKQYKCDDCEKYYYGHQQPPGDEEGKYTINLCFGTIESQLPSQLFYHPRVIVKPRPSKIDDPMTDVELRAQLQEDTLNTFIADRKNEFKHETFLALLESYFRFGVIEVGYSANFIDNPDAGKPILNEENDEAIATQPQRIVTSESLYFKRIPARTFRVGIGSKNQLERCDWVGYYEWHYASDLKKNPRYKNTSNINAGGKLHEKYLTKLAADDAHRDMIKVWKIWDLRTGMRRDFPEGGEKFFLEEEMDSRSDGSLVIPFKVLTKHPRLDEFYPVPPVFNWLSIQDEMNETRDMQKTHRKRFIRKFWTSVKPLDEEISKWEAGGDGTLVVTPQKIEPIQDAPLDPAIVRNIPQTKEDFREVSGTGGEQRGISEAETATQANIIDTESRIRESKSRDQIAEWLAGIAELALWFISNRMSLPFWIKTNVDMQSQAAPVEALTVMDQWQQITGDDINGINSDITVDVESLAPLTDAAERNSWLQAMQLVANPQMGPVIMANDVLLRKTLGYYKIRNEKDIMALKQFGAQALQMMMAAQQPQAGGGGTQPPPDAGPTPDNAQIGDQLTQQIGASGLG
jgi:hypothetical protein